MVPGVLLPRDPSGEHGPRLGPVLLDEEGEVDVGEEEGGEGGGEEAVESPAVEDEIPAEAEQREGK